MASGAGKGPKSLVSAETTAKDERSVRRELELKRAQDAFDRLEKERLLDFLVQSALPRETLLRLAADRVAVGAEERRLEVELLATWVIGRAFEHRELEAALADALDDRLALDTEPKSAEEWERLTAERPLEALWMLALSESKAIRKEFRLLADGCKRVFRASPDCPPPTWQYVDEHVLTTAELAERHERAAKELGETARRLESELARNVELREELKRLRRENAEHRAERAAMARRAAAGAESQRLEASAQERARVEDLERRLRKAEKEREHLERELERREQRAAGVSAAAGPAPAIEPEAVAAPTAETAEAETDAELSTRMRVLRQMLRKLIKKRKIGAAHTHEDNVYRGVPDHDKGLAKEAMDLLYREGILMPKTTIADPHVSIRPDRLAEVQQLLDGTVLNARLALWLDSES